MDRYTTVPRQKLVHSVSEYQTTNTEIKVREKKRAEKKKTTKEREREM